MGRNMKIIIRSNDNNICQVTEIAFVTLINTGRQTTKQIGKEMDRWKDG
jgi:hypothetical protein